jgi:hypothetical protein
MLRSTPTPTGRFVLDVKKATFLLPDDISTSNEQLARLISNTSTVLAGQEA